MTADSLAVRLARWKKRLVGHEDKGPLCVAEVLSEAGDWIDDYVTVEELRALVERLEQAEAAAELVVSQRGKGSYVSISREAYDACDAFLASIPKEEPCPDCFGKGLENQDDRPGILLGPMGEMECRRCAGRGTVASIPKEET